MKLAGRTVWITGASSGIGAALTTELVRRGAQVAVTARREERLEELAATAADRIGVHAGDVTDRDQLHRIAEAITEELGPVDVAVLNAGVWEQVDVRHFDAEVFRRHLDVNVMGVVNGIEAVLPGMLDRGRGVIAGVASVAGYRGLPAAEAYGATKAALINLFESLRIDLGGTGVRAVTVSPGFVESELTESNRFPMPFIIPAEEAAESICNGLERGQSEIVFPFPMAVLMKAANLVPVGLHAAAWQRANRP